MNSRTPLCANGSDIENRRCTLGGIHCCAGNITGESAIEPRADVSELQHANADPATDLLCSCTSHLGADLDIPQVCNLSKLLVPDQILTRPDS